MASRIIRPNTVYRVNVVVLPDSPSMIVKAFVSKGNGHQVSSASEIVDTGTSNCLLLKVLMYINDLLELSLFTNLVARYRAR